MPTWDDGKGHRYMIGDRDEVLVNINNVRGRI